MTRTLVGLVLLLSQATSSTAQVLEHLHTIGPVLSTNERFRGPFGVSVTANGEVLVSDDIGHRVYHFDRSMRLVRTLGESQGFAFCDAALKTADGYLVADTGNNRIIYLATSGAITRSVHRLGLLTGSLANPRSLARTAEGDLLIADWGNHRVRRLRGSGELRVTYANNLNRPIDAIEVPRLGIAVSDHRNDQVQIFSADGTPAGVLGRPGKGPGELRRPSGLAVGPQGNVWIADSGNARVQVFSLARTALATFAGAPGITFKRPTDLDFASDGRLFVADADHHAVFVFRLPTLNWTTGQRGLSFTETQSEPTGECLPIRCKGSTGTSAK